MRTVDNRYEYGIENTMIGTSATIREAKQAALAAKADSRWVYVYDRMARIGSPELWQNSGASWIVAEFRVMPQPDAAGKDGKQ